jgi:hypothetical protein
MVNRGIAGTCRIAPSGADYDVFSKSCGYRDWAPVFLKPFDVHLNGFIHVLLGLLGGERGLVIASAKGVALAMHSPLSPSGRGLG